MSANIANNDNKNVVYQSKNGAVTIYFNPDNPGLSDLDNLILSLCEIPQTLAVKHAEIRFENKRGNGLILKHQ